jgi:ribose transport system substrate-binding protein
MRKRLSQFLLGSFAFSCLVLTGCQYRSRSDTFILVASNLKLPYWKSVQDGFKDAAEQYKVTANVVGPDGYDPAAEADAFDDAVRSRPRGILVSVGDASKMGPAIKSAITAGIPVITVDSDAPLSSRLFFIGTNNLEAGRLGGQRLVERLSGKGNVVVFSIPGQPNIEERLKGYKDAIANSPNIKIVNVVATGGDSNSAFDATNEAIGRTGANKVDAFVCLESASGAAVGEVLKRNKITDRVVIAMDVNPETLSFIGDGTIDSTISQKPYTMGFYGLKALDEVSRFKPAVFRSSYAVDFKSPYPVFVDTGSTLISKYNLDLFQADAK